MTSLRWPTNDWAAEAEKHRRERIATAAMHALLMRTPQMPNEVLARQAAGLADALIAELDKKP